MNREMSRQHSAKVTFHDVAAYFFEEEWKLLHEWQKELYKNVMKEVHQALTSLGFHIVNADTLLEIYKGEEVYVEGPTEPQKRADTADPTSSCHSAVNPDLLLRIKHEEDLCCRKTRNEEETQIGSGSSTGNTPKNTSKMAKHANDPEKMEPDEALSGNHKGQILQCTKLGQTTMIQNKSQNQQIHSAGNRLDTTTGCGRGVGKTENVTKLPTQKGKKAYICTECGTCFSKPSLLVKHQRTHSRENPAKCSKHDISSTIPTHKQKHKGEKMHPCTECGKKFKALSFLHIHQQIHTGEKPYSCTKCGRSFRVQSSMHRHERVHTGEKPYPCTDCGKSFNTLSYMHIHQRIHTGEKPYPCAECGKSFRALAYLHKHQRIHTGHTPYPCTECGKSFTDQLSLCNHRQIHTVKPYPCAECGKSFRALAYLHTHQQIHIGHGTYPCTECGKSFTDQLSLFNHRRIHAEKPYPCVECGKSFKRISHLIRHQQIHIRSLTTTTREESPHAKIFMKAEKGENRELAD